MSVYMIIDAQDVRDEEMYGEYVKKVPETIKKFGGKYMVRGGHVEVIAGNWNPSRLIIVEFASADKLKAWWDSPEYKAIAPLRERSLKANVIVVEGA